MGCDSISSVTSYLLDPTKVGYTPDPDGTLVSKFNFADLEEVVTEAWGGAVKMFLLNEKNTPVVATTSGMAKLNGRTIQSYASEFKIRQDKRTKPRVNVGVIAREFLKFIKAEYVRHHEQQQIRNEFWGHLEFLVGGYGRDDPFPSLYRLLLKEAAEKVA